MTRDSKPLNPFAEIPRYKPVRKKRAKPRRGPLRDEAYKAWIRTLPCIICRLRELRSAQHSYLNRYVLSHTQQSPTECAHIGPRGLWQKCSDRETLPLCRDEHHQHGPESVHVLGRNFWSYHNLDRDKQIAELNRLYQEEQSP